MHKKRENKVHACYTLLWDQAIVINLVNSPTEGTTCLPFWQGYYIFDVHSTIYTSKKTVSSSEGTVLINSEKLNDPWTQTSTNDFIETKLSSDEIFVLGDQRQLSTSDSRTLGAIKISECKKLKYRYFPFHRIKSYEW